MKAAVMEAVRKPLVVREVPDPRPPAHGVVVRVEANGICRSDWHLWSGDWTWIGIGLPLPHVLGHEFLTRRLSPRDGLRSGNHVGD